MSETIRFRSYHILSKELMDSLFEYTKEGILIRKTTKFKGWQVLTKDSKGRRRTQVQYNKTTYNISCSAIVWMLHKGVWPTQQIDHINGVPDDDRIENLREVTPSQNAFNTVSKDLYRLKGVTKHNGKYEARIKINGKSHYLGAYETPEEAHEKYLEKAKELQGEYFPSRIENHRPIEDSLNREIIAHRDMYRAQKERISQLESDNARLVEQLEKAEGIMLGTGFQHNDRCDQFYDDKKECSCSIKHLREYFKSKQTTTEKKGES